MDKKHSNKWSDFKTSLELTQEELTEIDLRVELLGKLLNQFLLILLVLTPKKN